MDGERVGRTTRGNGGLTAVERRALEALDLEELLGLLRELIAIPSFGGAESPAQRRVAVWMADAGLQTDMWEIDLRALARHPQWTREIEREEALGVVGWVGDRAGGRPGLAAAGRDLLLNGHIDVVPGDEQGAWTAPPFLASVRDGRVYGRGAADMKGGLACALCAARAVRDAGVRLRGRLLVASAVGEEDGGTGTLATILRGHMAHGAVVVEPTQLRVVTAQAGSMMFRLTVHGLSAHGCVREEGVSAVEKFIPLLAALRRLEAERCGVAGAPRGGAPAAPVAGEPRSPLYARHRLPWPIEVGTVRAGDWPSSVPGALVAEGRYGVAVGEGLASARREFERAVAVAAADDPWLSEHPPVVEWWGGRFEPADTDPEDPVVTTTVAASAAVSGSTPALEGVTYGADMRLLVNVGGIPTVLFGPGDVRVAHMPDEHVAVKELQTAAQILVLVALRFCGVEE